MPNTDLPARVKESSAIRNGIVYLDARIWVDLILPTARSDSPDDLVRLSGFAPTVVKNSIGRIGVLLENSPLFPAGDAREGKQA
jgi:hypothetical protein